MQEIGGYFELDQLVNKPYYNDLLELNTGRNALAYLIRAKSIKKVFLPRFLCNSVSGALDRLNIEYESYRIDKNFDLLFDKKLRNNEYVYIVNYYGQLDDARIKICKERYENIIVDNTQSFFQRPVQGVDTIYSLRKYFGVPDGAYLSTDSNIELKLEKETSGHRMKHILGRYEGQASYYYDDFKENDESFKKLTLKEMSKLSRNIIGAIDYERVRLRRNENYLYLHNELSNNNSIDICVPDGPFSFPYYVKNGIEIRKQLANRKIYIPTLWPNVLVDNNENSIEYDYASNILPLPCDQRYDVNDMDRMIKELKKCIV